MRTAKNIVITSPKLLESKNKIDFLILAYMPLPSSTAFSIDAKLSSVKTISALFLATSVPVIPIATPISAAFKEGASFTPSPVIATILSFAL